jgi:hypothetical protein
MKRLFSVIVLIAVLTVPIAASAQTVEEDWVILTDPTSGPTFSIGEATGEGVSGTLFEYTVDHPSNEKGDFGLFPFLGKSFYKFVLKPAYKATKASGKTGGKAVKFFFVQIGHFLF